jgi:hypothetical protein
LLRFGGIVGAAALGAAIAAAPAALRLESASRGCGPLGTWAILVAAEMLPMTLAVLALRRARPSFDAFKREVPAVAMGLWLSGTFAALAVLGGVLRARTHHRALAGVVFAVSALLVAWVLALALVRLRAMMRRLPGWARLTMAVVAGASLGVVAAVARAHLARAGDSLLPPSQSAKLVDGLAFALAALLASGQALARRRPIALFGPPLVVAVLILGPSTLRTCPPLREAIDEQAPLLSGLVALLALH